MSNDGYVFKDQNKQPVEFNGFEVIENNQMQNAQSGEWDVINENASSYHTEYDKHMNMQRRVKGMAADKHGDNADMTAIKSELAKLSEAMQSEIASTPMRFRVQMADTAKIYESLIRSCNSFIKTAKKKSAIEKERLRMVKEVLAQAEKERIHFADLGSGMQIFKDRSEGMVLGNVLGGVLTDYRSIALTVNVEQMKKKNGSYEGFLEDMDTGEAERYILNSNSKSLSDQAKGIIGMSRICDFLGADNLCSKSVLAVGRDKKGKKYFGTKTEIAYYSSKNKKYKELKEMVDSANENNPAVEAHIEYTGDALKQLSRIYMLQLIAGKAEVNNTDDISLIYSEKYIEGKMTYTVTGAFLRFSHGCFSEMDASSLKKGTKQRPALDGLPLPVIDAEFAVSVLAMRAEDICFLVEDLQLSKAQKKAMISRITQIQKMLSDKIEREEQLPLEQRSIIKTSEWDNPDTLAELQNKCVKGQQIMFPELIGKDVRIEGAAGEKESKLERNYFTVYHTLKKKIQSEKNPRKACLILAHFASAISSGLMNDFCKDGMEVGSDIATRLVNELINEDIIKEAVKARYEAQKRIAEAYDAMAKKTGNVPEEFRNQSAIDNAINTRMTIMRQNAKANQVLNEDELRTRATAKIEEKLKEEYICYLMAKENITLSVDMRMINSLASRLGEGSFENNTMNIRNLNPYWTMKKFSQSYGASLTEGYESYVEISDRGNGLYDIMAGFNLLNKQKADEIMAMAEQEDRRLCLADCQEIAHLMRV